jgi:hypothetical protein
MHTFGSLLEQRRPLLVNPAAPQSMKKPQVAIAIRDSVSNFWTVIR